MDDFPRPLATVDIVPLTLVNDELAIGTLVREAEPEAGRAALPGGFVRPLEDDDVQATALRVLQDKCECAPIHLEQLAVYSGRARDPREWSLSVAFVAIVAPTEGPLTFAPASNLPDLPFDHDHIVAEAIARIRTKSGYSSLPLCFLEEPFTLPDAHRVYERITATALDRAAFRRKILDTGFLEDTGKTSRPTGRVARPAKLYKRTESLAFTPRNFGNS